jgi:hypothetical protein
MGSTPRVSSRTVGVMGAGWQADPTGRFELRYFDGAQWTEHVATRGVAAVDPIAAAAAPGLSSPSELPEPVPANPPGPPAGSPFDAPPSSDALASVFDAPRPSTPFGAPGRQPVEPMPLISEAGPARKGWLILAVVGLLVIATAVAYLVTRGDDGEDVERIPVAPTTPAVAPSSAIGEPASDASVGATPAVPSTATPVTIAPTALPALPTTPATAPPGVVSVGTELAADGGVVRVNRVTPNAEVDPLFAPALPNTVTEIEVELCAGSQAILVNGLSFTAFLADNSVAANFALGDQLRTFRMAPGGCARGLVTFEVPDGAAITAIVYTDGSFAEAGRWTAEGGTEPSARLAAPTAANTVPLGETATFGAGHTATVRAVTDDAEPLDDFFQVAEGQQLTQIDVEVCAGTEPLDVNGLYWLAVTAEGWIGASRLVTDTLPVIQVAAGQCVAGIVETTVPTGSTTTQIVHTDTAFAEVARWQR